MPFKAANPATQVKNYFVTIGPWNPELNMTTMRDELEHVVVSYYGAIFGRLSSSFEIGHENPDDPYHHVHLCIQLKREARWTKLNKELRKVVSAWPCRDDERRKVSTRFFVTGHCEDPWSVMTKYLTQPSKDKEVGEYLEFTERDYSAYVLHECAPLGWYADLFGFKGKAHHEWCKKIYHSEMKRLARLEAHKKKYPPT